MRASHAEYLSETPPEPELGLLIFVYALCFVRHESYTYIKLYVNNVNMYFYGLIFFIPMSQKVDVTPGDRIKFIREKMGLSQEELEKISGIRRTQLSAYENNRIGVGSKIAKKLGAALGVHPQEILFEAKSDSPTTVEVFAQIDPESSLTDEEKKILKEYRELEERDRLVVKGMIKQLKKAEQSPHPEERPKSFQEEVHKAHRAKKGAA